VESENSQLKAVKKNNDEGKAEDSKLMIKDLRDTLGRNESSHNHRGGKWRGIGCLKYPSKREKKGGGEVKESTSSPL